MVQSPSWEANWFAASQEIPHILRNPKVHYRTHKRLPPVSILGQPNPVHIPTSHLLEIRPNIIHPSTPRSPQWSLSPRFTHQDPIHPLFLTHTRHMPSPSHSSRFYHPHNIAWGRCRDLYLTKNTIPTKDRHPCPLPPGGIRIRNPRKRAAIDRRLRPRGNRHRLQTHHARYYVHNSRQTYDKR